MNMRRLVLYTLASAVLAGCASKSLMRQPPVAAVLEQQATAGPLRVADAKVITDNDAAFAAKLAVIDGAKHSLDLAYYIFADDYSSSRLTQGLIDAARRGVKVRLLVDYLSAYKDLDRFSWLQREGSGRIEVRLYNRPTVEILKDAAFLTLSCAAVGVKGGVAQGGDDVACDREKIAAVDQHFDAAASAASAASTAPAAQDPLNLGYAGSGQFLSGLYGKNPQLMAYAIARGQELDLKALAAGAQSGDAARTETLKNLGKLYFKARFLSGIEGLTARIKLAVIRLAFAEQVNPVFNAINSHLPVTRQKSEVAQKDWDYLTEFLHHKFLLADGANLVVGGRNVEDAYHLHESALSAKYTFMDTDVRLQLASPDAALPASFERLWNLHAMVATIAEVRLHAPNDLLENFSALTAAQDACNQGRDQVCVDREVDKRFLPLERRLALVGAEHKRRLRRYAADYRPAAAPPPMQIDAGASIHYLENLPVANDRRIYGVPHDRQAQSNKHIHALWRSALQGVCASADPAPRDVVFHSAYLFMPADLLRDVSAVLDGRRPCPGVTLSLLTNSLATTDLNIVNLLATWQLKALADHLAEQGGRPADAASLRYFEYVPEASGGRSLHSKVMVFDQNIFIGSANADVRSLMMDSNNGVFISNAPRFAGAYHQFLRQVLANPTLTVDHSALIGRDAQTLGTEMNQLIDQLLARYAKERLSDQQRSELKQQIRDTTVKVYDLSRRIMRGDTKAADEFNALFKVI